MWTECLVEIEIFLRPNDFEIAQHCSTLAEIIFDFLALIIYYWILELNLQDFFLRGGGVRFKSLWKLCLVQLATTAYSSIEYKSEKYRKTRQGLDSRTAKFPQHQNKLTNFRVILILKLIDMVAYSNVYLNYWKLMYKWNLGTL